MISRNWLMNSLTLFYRRVHTFQNLYVENFSNADSQKLVQFLFNNTLHETRDFVACYKPYGISPYGVEHDNHQDDQALIHDSPSVASVLPQLAEAYKMRDLRIAKSVPRYCSGPILFAKKQEAIDRIKRSIQTSMNMQTPHIHLLIICVGVPDPSEGSERFGSRKVLANNAKHYIATDNLSQNQIRRKYVRAGMVEYRTEASANDCSLVQLNTTTLKYHLPRLFITLKGSPILGDNIYQWRVARLLNETILMEPTSASIRNQYIPLQAMQHLKLSLEEYHKLPMFMHVQRFVLHNYYQFGEGKKHCVINASPPAHFVNVCEMLGLLEPKTETHTAV